MSKPDSARCLTLLDQGVLYSMKGFFILPKSTTVTMTKIHRRHYDEEFLKQMGLNFSRRQTGFATASIAQIRFLNVENFASLQRPQASHYK